MLEFFLKESKVEVYILTSYFPKFLFKDLSAYCSIALLAYVGFPTGTSFGPCFVSSLSL
jgi:hypothetical protein